MSMYDQHYQRYVAGFAFNPERTHVVLVLKNRPVWQCGWLNAVGGKIEEFDRTDADAMVREFREETGVVTMPEQWTHCVTLTGPGHEVVFYRSYIDLTTVQTMEDAPIYVCETARIPSNIVPNLKWLLPLCADNTGVVFPIYIKDTK